MDPMLDHMTAGRPGAPSLLLLHAGGMTRKEWEPFVAAWSGSFHITAPTALAHGASPRAGSFTLDDLARTTLRLLDHLGIDRTHVVGSSMGGATALRIALRKPDRIDRLVLYRTGFRSQPPVREALRRFATPENWQRWGLEEWMSREHEPQGGPDAWRDVIRRVGRAFEASQQTPSLGVTDLARITSRCLIICGDRDDLVPLEDAVEMYRAISDASLWVVPSAGHVMGMETWRRPAFESEIRRFLLAPPPPGSA